jgi:hypothetical protein
VENIDFYQASVDGDELWIRYFPKQAIWLVLILEVKEIDEIQ